MIHDFDPAILSTSWGSIYWYGAVYSFGFAGVFLWFWLRQRRIGLTNWDVFTLTILFASGIMVGGRVFDILVYELDYYRDRPLAAFDWWQGGMASHGVLLGGLLATVAFAMAQRIPLLVLLDEIVVPGVFLLAVGRLGNFIEGGVVGSVANVPWAFVYPDLEGPRHPVALYESAKNFAILPVLIWAIGRWPAGSGIVMSLFVLFYALLRFLVDLFRDYEAAWLGIGTGQVFNLVMAAAGLMLLIGFLRKPRPVPPERRVAPRNANWIQIAVLAFLILYPLGIPTSWTQQNIIEKRQNSENL
ncbi:MAG: prolipoprotein diacylglyceryl transferase [Rhodobacteraceae bacterium]|nr:prolipoprotein diacylglyceryl transferase [Paracoccaceae bacterium]